MYVALHGSNQLLSGLSRLEIPGTVEPRNDVEGPIYFICYKEISVIANIELKSR